MKMSIMIWFASTTHVLQVPAEGLKNPGALLLPASASHVSREKKLASGIGCY